MSLFVNKRITNLIKTFVTPQPTLSLLPLVTLLSQQNFMSNKKNKSTKEALTASAASAQAASNQESAVFINKNGHYCLNIFAKPGAKETVITDVKADAIDVKIAAPPVDGEANKELIRYISKLFKLRNSDVSLDKGNKSRNKILILENCRHLSMEQLMETLKNESEN